MTITDTTRSPFFTATDPAPAPLAPVAELRARMIGPVTTPVDPSYAGTVSPWQLAVAVHLQIAVEAVVRRTSSRRSASPGGTGSP